MLPERISLAGFANQMESANGEADGVSRADFYRLRIVEQFAIFGGLAKDAAPCDSNLSRMVVDQERLGRNSRSMQGRSIDRR